MTKSLDIQEVAIVLQATNLDPAILNPSLFDYGAVFPTDWESLRQPVYQRNGVLILFKNSISLVVQPNKVTLSELVLGKEIHEVYGVTPGFAIFEKIEWRPVHFIVNAYLWICRYPGPLFCRQTKAVLPFRYDIEP